MNKFKHKQKDGFFNFHNFYNKLVLLDLAFNLQVVFFKDILMFLIKQIIKTYFMTSLLTLSHKRPGSGSSALFALKAFLVRGEKK